MLALVPIAIAAGIVAGGLRGFIDGVEHMPRIVVPGTGDVVLEAGDYIAFGEMESIVDGAVYTTSSLQLRCRMASTSGDVVTLTTPSARTNYAVPGFAGQSMFALTVPAAGTYQLACDGQGGPATIAFGTGIGTTIVVLLVSVFAGLGGAIAIFFVVRRQRRRSLEQPPIPTAVVLP